MNFIFNHFRRSSYQTHPSNRYSFGHFEFINQPRIYLSEAHPVVATNRPISVIVSQAIPVYQENDFQLRPETIAEIQNRVENVASQATRVAMLRKETTVERIPGKVLNVVHRLPSPDGDIIEKTHVIQQEPDIINLHIQRPRTPESTVVERRVFIQSDKPVIRHRISAVEPRSYTPCISRI